MNKEYSSIEYPKKLKDMSVEERNKWMDFYIQTFQRCNDAGDSSNAQKIEEFISKVDEMFNTDYSEKLNK